MLIYITLFIVLALSSSPSNLLIYFIYQSIYVYGSISSFSNILSLLYLIQLSYHYLILFYYLIYPSILYKPTKNNKKKQKIKDKNTSELELNLLAHKSSSSSSSFMLTSFKNIFIFTSSLLIFPINSIYLSWVQMHIPSDILLTKSFISNNH